MRKFWLTLTDKRLKAVMKTLELSGPGIGDLAADPGQAPVFFRPLRASLAAAAAAPSSAASGKALAAAEDFASRLERTFSDITLLQAPPDAPVREALLHLQQACAEAQYLLSPWEKAAAASRLRAHCTGGRRTLELAKAAADRAVTDFPGNLKFSSIYSGFDAVFDALERCAEALYII